MNKEPDLDFFLNVAKKAESDNKFPVDDMYLDVKKRIQQKKAESKTKLTFKRKTSKRFNLTWLYINVTVGLLIAVSLFFAYNRFDFSNEVVIAKSKMSIQELSKDKTYQFKNEIFLETIPNNSVQLEPGSIVQVIDQMDKKNHLILKSG